MENLRTYNIQALLVIGGFEVRAAGPEAEWGSPVSGHWSALPTYPCTSAASGICAGGGRIRALTLGLGLGPVTVP